MASVVLEIIEKLRKSSHDQTAREIKENFENMGAQAANSMANSFEQEGPKVRRAMMRAMDINAQIAKQEQERTKLINAANEAKQQSLRIEQSIADRERDSVDSARRLWTLENDILDVRRRANAAGLKQVSIETDVVKAKAEQVKHNKELRDLELRISEAKVKGQKTITKRNDDGTLAGSMSMKNARLQQIEMQKRAAKETENLRIMEASLTRARADASAVDSGVSAMQKTINDARNAGTKITRDLQRGEDDLKTSRREATRLDETILGNNEKINRSYRDRIDILDRLRRAKEDDERKGGGGGGKNGIGDKIAQTFGNAITSLPLMPGGEAGAAVFAAIAPVLIEVAQAATTATEAIWAMPAAAAAAGAGIGVLMVATDGFDKALKNMGDPKKFAEALKGMAPAAQQAALEIQQLVQGPLGDLKTAIQNSFFGGMAQEIHNLVDQYLPAVRTLALQISGAFNTMLQGVGNQLMNPTTQQQLQATFKNIGEFFTNAAPAAQSLTRAFVQIAQVGSSFLPQLGTEIANAADKFANFIDTNSKNGNLQKWITEGIDALRDLGGALYEIAQIWYNTFGSAQDSAKDLKDSLHDIGQVLRGDLSPIWDSFFNDVVARTFNGLNADIGGFENKVVEMCNNFVQNFVNGPIQVLNRMLGLWNEIPGVPKVNIPTVPTFSVNNGPGNGPLPHLNDIGPNANNPTDSGQPNPPGLPNSGHPWHSAGGPNDPQANGSPFNPPPPPPAPPPSQTTGATQPGQGPLPTAGLPGYAPIPVPAVPGKPESDRNKRDDIFKSLNPNDFAVDPYAGLGIGPPGGPGADGMPAFGGPGAQGVPAGAPMPTGDVPAPGIPGQGQGGPPPPLQFGTGGKPYAKPGYGYTSVNDEELVKKQQELQEDGWALQKAQMDLEVLKRDTTSTQEEILEKEHDVIRERWKLQDDQADYRKTAEGKWNKVGSGSDQIGVGLDSDLGISKGLAGMADNLVRFVGSMLAAPLETALQQTFGPSNGSFGIIGALFGPGGTGGAGADGTPAAGGPGADGSAPGAGYSGDAALLSHVPAGKYSPGRSLGSDLAQGLGDCSSAVSDLVNLLDGQPTGQGQMSTGTEASWLTQRGFMPTNVPMPGTMQVGFNADHTQATLPGGTPFNWGSKEAAAQGGVDPGSGGAWMPGFTQHFYRPVGAGWAPGAANGGLGAGPLGPTGAGGAVPVFVTNMGVGGMPGSASPPSPTPSSTGTPGTPSSTPSGAPGSPSGAPSGAPGTGTGAGQVGPGIGGGAAGLPGGAPGGPFLGGAAGFVGDAGGPAPPGPGSGVSGPNGAPGGPGAGAPAGNNPYASQGEVGYNSSQAGWQPQGQGFSGLGGLPLAALNTAASAIPIPGAGQAAQTAIQGINRTIAYGGQAASIGVQGLMQTFLPSDSPLSDPSKSWFGKLLGGFAGARPATGNSAGSSDKAQKDIGKSENDPQQGGGKGGGNVNNGVHIENFVQAPNRNSAQQVGSDLLYQTAQGGQRP